MRYETIIPCNPISDNHLYLLVRTRYGIRKFMTTKGRKYKQLVEKCVRKPFTPTASPVIMDIKIVFGDRRKRDVHGHLKCLIDSLQGIFYKDDSQIVELHVTKSYNNHFPRSEVKVYERDE